MHLQTEIEELLTTFVKLLEQLHWHEPNRFLGSIQRAGTVGQWYDVVLGIRSAANSKELRDTDNEQVHKLCNEILGVIKDLDDFFIADVSPRSAEQKNAWLRAVMPAESGQYAFRRDGCIRISLLDATLEGASIRVRRMWTHVCSGPGSTTDFELELDATQTCDIQGGLEKLAAAKLVIKSWIGQQRHKE